MKNERHIYCKPLTPELWTDLETLFGKSGAYYGCWCMYWRCSNKEFEQITGAQRKNALYKTVTESDHAPGILAYLDEKPVGWLALSPREEYTRLVKSRVIKPFDDQPVWSIVCFFIHKNYRGIGLTNELLTFASDYAKSKGAKILESYPIEGQDKINELSAYVGAEKWFLKDGFVKMSDTNAKGDGKKRVLMRKNL